MAIDSTVNIDHTDEEIQGQPQAQAREPHDGTVKVRETVVTTDRVILDPNADDAVQIPEGVGASSVDRANPLAEALSTGTPEAQFGNDPVIETTVAVEEPEKADSSKTSKTTSSKSDKS